MIRENDRKAECVGCGYCCIQQPCAYGRTVHPEAITNGEICPSLQWTGERYICTLMTNPDSSGEMYKWLLNAGQGCKNFLNPWRNDVKERQGKEG